MGANDELIFDGHSVALDARGRVIALGKGFAEDVLVVDLAVKSDRLPACIVRPDYYFRRARRSFFRRCRWASAITSANAVSNRSFSVCPAALIRRWWRCWRRRRWGRRCAGGFHARALFEQGSLSDAAALAKNLGIRYEVLPIEPVFKSVEKQLQKVFAGTKPNEAEENVQSRLRGVTLMALLNKFGALVLTTGNKSEMAVGYCTLYGDMCSALAPLADVFKTDIYRIARWVNRDREIIPAASISKPPSAELRPNQTDQDSLPPYETLDQILDAYVVKNLGREDIMWRDSTRRWSTT